MRHYSESRPLLGLQAYVAPLNITYRRTRRYCGASDYPKDYQKDSLSQDI